MLYNELLRNNGSPMSTTKKKKKKKKKKTSGTGGIRVVLTSPLCAQAGSQSYRTVL